MNLSLSCSICSSPEETSESSTPILDTYTGAQTAYSFNRKLRTAYSGSAFRVRRDNDNAELDIGYSGTDVDESALTTFVGVNSAYVVTAYDNSGNSNDWTQSTASKQPRIVNAGTVEKVNGKIAIYSDTTASSQDNLGVTLTGAAATTAFHVYKNDRDITYVNYGVPTVHYGNSWNGQGGVHYSAAGTPVSYVNGSSIGTSRNNLYDATNTLQVINSYTALNLSNANWSEFNTDYDGSDAFRPITYIQETIIYDSDKSSDRSAIETNINEYYSIY